MKKLELYYDKDTDTIQLIENETLRFHDESIGSTDIILYFDAESIEDLANTTAVTVINGYRTLMADFKHNCGIEEFKAYHENVKKQKVRGELIWSGEIEDGIFLFDYTSNE